MCFSGLYHSTGSLGRLQDSLQTSAKSSLSTLSELCFSEFGKNRNHLVPLNSAQHSLVWLQEMAFAISETSEKTNYMQNNSPEQQTMMGARL